MACAGTYSAPATVHSGLPQGSILGPLLFRVYVNALPDVSPGVSMFADDTTQLVSATTKSELFSHLQTGIKAVVHWMHSWHLKPNAAKTEILFFSLSPLQPTPQFTFPNSHMPIKVVTSHKH